MGFRGENYRADFIRPTPTYISNIMVHIVYINHLKMDYCTNFQGKICTLYKELCRLCVTFRKFSFLFSNKQNVVESSCPAFDTYPAVEE